jgi:signal transduction histidine kinase
MPRLSLRTKLVLYAILVLAPVLALLLMAFEASYERRREIVLDTMAQTAEAVALATDVSFDEAIAVGRALASDPEVQSLDSARTVPRLRHLAPLYPEYDNISVFDLAGNLRGESAATQPGVPRSIADRAFFQRALADGEPTTIEVLVSRRSGEPATGVVVPFFDAEGEPLGLVALSFNLDRLRSRIESVGLLAEQRLGLLDPSGRLVVLTDAPELSWAQRDLSERPAVRDALAGQTVRTTDFRLLPGDAPRVLALAPSPKYGWLASVDWPATAAFAPAEDALRRELLVFAAIIVVSLAGAALLASYISKPVRRLAVHARALGDGDLDRRVAIRTGDELEHLGGAFNAMAERLQTSLAQLRAARASAERGREQAETARAEAQRAVGVRDEFLASASHELRTPLAHVKGFASTLRQTDVEWDEATRQEFLAEIERETDRLAKMIGDLLDMTRLESGELERGERTPLRPAALVAGGLDRLRGLVNGRPLAVDVPNDLPPIQGDASQLERVVANLVENATKYADPGTPIRIAGVRRNGELELRVEDAGPGIPPEYREQVFEKFFRLKSDRPWVAGSGLGLAICRRIVAAHGGRIYVEDSGAGARFVVRLPTAASTNGDR